MSITESLLRMGADMSKYQLKHPEQAAHRHPLLSVLPAMLAVLLVVAIVLLALVKPVLALAIPLAVGSIVCVLRPTVGLYLLVALLFFAPVTINLGWPGQATTYVFIGALALAVGGRLGRALSRNQRFLEAGGILWLLIPLALVGVVHGTSPSEWFTHTRPLLVLVVVCWHVVAEARLDPQRLRRVAVIVARAAPALFLMAAHQCIAGYSPRHGRLRNLKVLHLAG